MIGSFRDGDPSLVIALAEDILAQNGGLFLMVIHWRHLNIGVREQMANKMKGNFESYPPY